MRQMWKLTSVTFLMLRDGLLCQQWKILLFMLIHLKLLMFHYFVLPLSDYIKVGTEAQIIENLEYCLAYFLLLSTMLFFLRWRYAVRQWPSLVFWQTGYDAVGSWAEALISSVLSSSTSEQTHQRVHAVNTPGGHGHAKTSSHHKVKCAFLVAANSCGNL